MCLSHDKEHKCKYFDLNILSRFGIFMLKDAFKIAKQLFLIRQCVSILMENRNMPQFP